MAAGDIGRVIFMHKWTPVKVLALLIIALFILNPFMKIVIAANPTILDEGITFEDLSVVQAGPIYSSIGGHLRLWYYVNNPTSSPISAILGATIRASDGTPTNDSPRDKSVSLSPGSMWYSRDFYIGPSQALGTYDVAYAIWSSDWSQQYAIVWKTGWLVVTNLVSVSLSGATTTGVSSPGGTINIGSTTYPLPATAYLQTRTYWSGTDNVHASAPAGYVVDHWGSSGSVSFYDFGTGYIDLYVHGTGTLTVYFKLTATFDLSASPSSLSVVRGGQVQSTVTVTSRNSFSGSVTLTLVWNSGTPSWVTRGDLTPNPVNVPNGGAPTSTLTIGVSSSASGGPFSLTIVGTTTGQPSKTYDLSLTIIIPTNTLTTYVVSGLGSVSPDCAPPSSPNGCSENVGDPISIIATPQDSNWAFSSWSISGASCTNGPSISPCTFNMPNAAVLVTATFLGGSLSGQITAFSLDKSVLLSTDTVSISVTVKNTGNIGSGFYLSISLFGPRRVYSGFAPIITLAPGASTVVGLSWSPQWYAGGPNAVDAGTYSLGVWLWNQRPNVTPIPSTLTAIASYAVPFALMVDQGNSYIEVTGGNCNSLGNCRLIHVHVSSHDLGSAKTFLGLRNLLPGPDVVVTLTSLLGGAGPTLGDIVNIINYVLANVDGSKQLQNINTYGYDFTIMQVYGQYGKYYETSLVGVKAAAWQDLVSEIESLGVTMADIAMEVAVAVTFPPLAPVMAVQIFTSFVLVAADTFSYVTSFFSQIPSSYFLNGDVPAYSVVSFQPFGFSIATPSSQPTSQGGSATFSFTVTTTSGSPQPVTLSLLNPPVGIGTLSWNPGSTITPSTSGTQVQLTIPTTCSTPAQAYSNLQISGSGGGASGSSSSFTLTVTSSSSCQVFDFSLSNSGGITVTQGGSGSKTITVMLTSGSTQSVSLSCTSPPTGVACSFNPQSSNPTFSSTLTVSTSSSAPTGSSTITVTGSGGGKTHTTQFTLTVNPPPTSCGDEFSYSTVQALQAAGWTVGNPSYVSVDGSTVQLDNDGSQGSSISRACPAMSSWRVEARATWVGRSYGSLSLSVTTTYHSYGWLLDGYYPQYSFSRDGTKVIIQSGYVPALNVWMTLAIQRSGSTITLYQNGNLIASYSETDTHSDSLTGVAINSGWKSTVKYDYIHVTTPLAGNAVNVGDLVVWRGSSGTWFVRHQDGSSWNQQWGLSGDVPLLGDVDGDGVKDLIVFRSGTWYILKSTAGYAGWNTPSSWMSVQWGLPGDKPLVADFDGDGKADLVVWRPSTGMWYILKSSANYAGWSTPSSWVAYQWGLNGDTPLIGHFDGDGKPDLAVWHPSGGMWYILKSSANYAGWNTPSSWVSYQWGLNGDTPLIGDFDGDGKSDLAVWRPSSGTWYILKSSANYAGWNTPSSWVAYQWGLNGDKPLLADFDSDGKPDLVVWRAGTGTWYILKSSAGYAGWNTPSSWVSYQWGMNGDTPLPVN
jgi:hypothetical protein